MIAIMMNYNSTLAVKRHTQQADPSKHSALNKVARSYSLQDNSNNLIYRTLVAGVILSLATLSATFSAIAFSSYKHSALASKVSTEEASDSHLASGKEMAANVGNDNGFTRLEDEAVPLSGQVPSEVQGAHDLHMRSTAKKIQDNTSRDKASSKIEAVSSNGSSMAPALPSSEAILTHAGVKYIPFEETEQAPKTETVSNNYFRYFSETPKEDPFANYYSPTVYNDYNVLLDTSMGPMLYYNQHDSHWGSFLYGGSDPITSYGCGPTAAAMVVNAFGNIHGPITPKEMAEWSSNYGYYAPQSGSYHDYIPAVLSAFDLMVDSVSERTVENVSRLLMNGHIMVALMGKGALTNGGHFVVITKLNPNGTVSIADPNSYEKSCREWDLAQILRELKQSYDSGGPLWSVRRLW